MFVRNGGAWTQDDRIVPTDGVSGDEFGVSVSLDGSTALIGAPTRHFDPRPGSVYAYALDIVEDDDGIPSTLSGFRYAVYSQTAAELFWNGSSENGRIVGYEIRRNGVLVETRDATSYFDSGLIPGMTQQGLYTGDIFHLQAVTSWHLQQKLMNMLAMCS